MSITSDKPDYSDSECSGDADGDTPDDSESESSDDADGEQRKKKKIKVCSVGMKRQIEP